MQEPDEQVRWGGLPTWSEVRLVLGLVLAAAASALGGFILGEYQFDGLLPLVAGLLFGLVVAEIALEVGQRRSLAAGAAAGLLAAGGLLWAGWRASGEGLEPMPTGAWLAAAVALAAATVRGARRGGRRRS